MHWEAVRRWTPSRRAAALLVTLLAIVACAPERVSAQRTERFALSAHASLGFGGKLSHCWDSDPRSEGFDQFRCESLFGHVATGRLRPSPGLGLRLSYVGWRYVSLGLAASVRSLAVHAYNATRFTDLGVIVGGRYPLALGSGGRLVTPYVALTVGLTTMHDAAARSRMQDPGYHVSGVAGVEVELVPGFGVYVESGVTHLRIDKESSMSTEASSWGFELTATHAVLNIGLRVAR